jgi:pimeloyl-ACP methyl ester carboxylesterase
MAAATARIFRCHRLESGVSIAAPFAESFAHWPDSSFRSARQQLASIWAPTYGASGADALTLTQQRAQKAADIDAIVCVQRYQGGARIAARTIRYLTDRTEFEPRWLDALRAVARNASDETVRVRSLPSDLLGRHQQNSNQQPDGQEHSGQTLHTSHHGVERTADDADSARWVAATTRAATADAPVADSVACHLLWGDADAVAPFAVAEAVHAASAHKCTLQRLPNVGHFVMLEASDAWVAAVVALGVRAVPPPAASS